GTVVTGGTFVASSRDVSDASFMAGGSLEFKGTSNGGVVNDGSITSKTGNVALIGRSVRNDGSIRAPNGMGGMGAGEDVLLSPTGEQHLLIKVGTGDVINTGSVSGAAAELRAAGGNVYALAGNNGGIVRATGTQQRDGHVWLTAGGNVIMAGNVAAENAD